MTLTPLLDVLTADAGVSRTLAVARSGVANADITVAAGARPSSRRWPARAAAPSSRSRRPPVRPRTWPPRSAASSSPIASRTSRRGRRCPTSG